MTAWRLRLQYDFVPRPSMWLLDWNISGKESNQLTAFFCWACKIENAPSQNHNELRILATCELTMAAMNYSFEHSKSILYGADIRWRTVHQRLMNGLTYEQIAVNLNVDPSTVRRTIKKKVHRRGYHWGQKIGRRQNSQCLWLTSD